MNDSAITADTITPEAVVSMTIEQCIQTEADDAKAEAAEEEAVQASQRTRRQRTAAKRKSPKKTQKSRPLGCAPLLSSRDSGEWWFIAEQKAKADNVPFGSIVESHCKATGKGKTAIYDNMRVRNNWGRFDWPDLEGFQRHGWQHGNPPT